MHRKMLFASVTAVVTILVTQSMICRVLLHFFFRKCAQLPKLTKTYIQYSNEKSIRETISTKFVLSKNSLQNNQQGIFIHFMITFFIG